MPEPPVPAFLSLPKGGSQLHLEVYPNVKNLGSRWQTEFDDQRVATLKGILCVMRGSTLIDRFVVVCGPAHTVTPTDKTERRANPTNPKTYVLGPPEPHTSTDWDWAELPGSATLQRVSSSSEKKGDRL
jgi:hypothetical protein